jgi:hypothetical protein
MKEQGKIGAVGAPGYGDELGGNRPSDQRNCAFGFRIASPLVAEGHSCSFVASRLFFVDNVKDLAGLREISRLTYR